MILNRLVSGRYFPLTLLHLLYAILILKDYLHIRREVGAGHGDDVVSAMGRLSQGQPGGAHAVLFIISCTVGPVLGLLELM